MIREGYSGRKDKVGVIGKNYQVETLFIKSSKSKAVVIPSLVTYRDKLMILITALPYSDFALSPNLDIS